MTRKEKMIRDITLNILHLDSDAELNEIQSMILDALNAAYEAGKAEPRQLSLSEAKENVVRAWKEMEPGEDEDGEWGDDLRAIRDANNIFGCVEVLSECGLCTGESYNFVLGAQIDGDK